MILWILLTIVLCWVALMGWYWAHGCRGEKDRQFLRGNPAVCEGSVCRSCGKPMDWGQDTCSDCYGDPNHG